VETGLKDKVVVVTGGAAGIGNATVQLFLAEGAKVAAGDLDVTPLKELEAGDQLLPVEVDLGDPAGPGELVEHAVAEFGGIDCVVNNVGIVKPRDSFVSITDDDWDQIMQINFYCAMRTTRAAIPHLLERGKGSLVHVASEVARQPDPFFIDYSVTKAAIVCASKALSVEYGPQGIRSNCVTPGPTRTPLWDKPGGFVDYLAAEYDMGREEAVDHFAKVIRNLPLGRIGQPEDVAAAIVFLSSDLAKQTTGSDYRVDSGVSRFG
jgi:NAD(P)-dependent dehydrogenase (short-subunit alcohol dehydrogenase family)